MATKLNPYFTFDGVCRQAMEFYASVLGGVPEFMTFGDMGGADEIRDQIMHSALLTPAGYTIYASDLAPGMQPTSNGQISISGDEPDLLRNYWDGLADGGVVTVALEQQMWGDVYGSLIDKFGVTWLVNIAGASTTAGE